MADPIISEIDQPFCWSLFVYVQSKACALAARFPNVIDIVKMALASMLISDVQLSVTAALSGLALTVNSLVWHSMMLGEMLNWMLAVPHRTVRLERMSVCGDVRSQVSQYNKMLASQMADPIQFWSIIFMIYLENAISSHAYIRIYVRM